MQKHIYIDPCFSRLPKLGNKSPRSTLPGMVKSCASYGSASMSRVVAWFMVHGTMCSWLGITEYTHTVYYTYIYIYVYMYRYIYMYIYIYVYYICTYCIYIYIYICLFRKMCLSGVRSSAPIKTDVSLSISSTSGSLLNVTIHHLGLAKHRVPSGKLTVCYWKYPFIVSFPIKNVDFPWLC